MRLILVRHGESIGNIVTQDMPDAPLTPVGVRQASLTAKYLKDFGITKIAASPLIRSLATAQPLAQRLTLPISVWQELVEVRNKGLYIGPSRQELAAEFPEAVFGHDIKPEGWIYPGDEKPHEAMKRAHSVLHRLREEYAGETVAVFAHATFNRYILYAVLGITDYEKYYFRQNNGCVNIIDFTDDSIRIDVLNHWAHQSD